MSRMRVLFIGTVLACQTLSTCQGAGDVSAQQFGFGFNPGRRYVPSREPDAEMIPSSIPRRGGGSGGGRGGTPTFGIGGIFPFGFGGGGNQPRRRYPGGGGGVFPPFGGGRGGGRGGGIFPSFGGSGGGRRGGGGGIFPFLFGAGGGGRDRGGSGGDGFPFVFRRRTDTGFGSRRGRRDPFRTDRGSGRRIPFFSRRRYDFGERRYDSRRRRDTRFDSRRTDRRTVSRRSDDRRRPGYDDGYDRRRRGRPDFGLGGFPWYRNRYPSSRSNRGDARVGRDSRYDRDYGRRRRSTGGSRRRSFFDDSFFGDGIRDGFMNLEKHGFGFFSPYGASSFFGGSDKDRKNVCKETRESSRPLREGEKMPPQEGQPGGQCTSSQGFKFCVTNEVIGNMVKTTETLEKCCPGTVPTFDGCKKILLAEDGYYYVVDRVSPNGALEQFERLKSKKFLELIFKAGLNSSLEQQNTFFVPSDTAIETFLNNSQTEPSPDELKNILESHIVDDSIPLAVLALRTPIESRTGSLWLSVGSRGPQVNCQRLLSRDRPTRSGGTIHTIDGVILPANDTMMEAIRARPELSAFAKLLNATGLDKDIDDWVGITILAPSNDALAAVTLPEKQKDQLAILRDHVVSGLQCQGGLPGVGMTADRRTLAFNSPDKDKLTLVPVRRRAGITTVNLLNRDQVTRGGVLHVIDQVILRSSVRETLQTLLQLNSTKAFAQLITSAGLQEEINSGNITVLVPPDRIVSNSSLLPTDPAEVKALLGRHLALRTLRDERPRSRYLRVPTAAGSALLVSGWPGRRLLIQCVPVSDWLELGKRDVIVLGLRRVLPPTGGDLATLIGEDPELSNFAAVLNKSGLAEKLKDGEFTLLAVVNTGFKEYGKLDTEEKAKRFIELHTMKDVICCSSLSRYGGQYELLGGGAVFASALSPTRAAFRAVGEVSAPAVQSLSCDAVASNGVLHKLAMPLAGPGAAVDPFSVQSGFPYYFPFQF